MLNGRVQLRERLSWGHSYLKWCCLDLQDQVQERSFVAERLAAFTSSPDGSACAGGGISGAIYVWDTASGRLLRTWPAHYQVSMCS